jgi:hypothetical protein
MKKSEVVDALKSLNWNYGRGDVVSVNVARGTFVRKPFQCRPETRTFKVRGRTVFALRHQKTV